VTPPSTIGIVPLTAPPHNYPFPPQHTSANAGILPHARELPSDVKLEHGTLNLHPQTFAGELDRLSSLTLAAGKDFNDELTFIMNHAEDSIDRLGPDHPAGAGLVELQHAAMRCAETTRSLLLLTQRARDAVRCAKVRTSDADPGDRDFL